MWLIDGFECVWYVGNLSLSGFDLGGWIGSDDFGFVDFSLEVVDGYGFIGDLVFVWLMVVIECMMIKGYIYENVILIG